MITVASLLYGEGNYGKSICMAVETGFDTDCNGATVGSIFGMAHGIESIPEYWQRPINDKLQTSIFGVGTVSISERVSKNFDANEKITHNKSYKAVKNSRKKRLQTYPEGIGKQSFLRYN